jgi:uncharacterized protein (TIRG00374 family)
MQNTNKKIIVGILVSIITILLIVFLVDFNEVWCNLKKLSLGSFIFLLLLYLLSMLLRSYRWFAIIRQKEEVSIVLIFKALVYGYMINQLLPAKVGEVARAEYVARKSTRKRSFLIGTIVAERIFDFFIIMIFFGFSILYSETVMERLHSNIVPVIIMLVLFALAIILLFNVKVFKSISKFFPKKIEIFFNNIIDNLSLSFELFKSYKKTLRMVVVSIIIWSITLVMFFIIMKDLSISIPFYAYFFIVSAGTFGMIIPSTSANIGVYHAVAMGSLMLFMVPKEQALSFAIIAHAIDFFPNIILGSIFLGLGRLKKLK